MSATPYIRNCKNNKIVRDFIMFLGEIPTAQSRYSYSQGKVVIIVTFL